MDDYISREALIDRLSKNLSACNPGTFSEMCYADAIETVKHLPAADVAPVVRCRECKHHYWVQEPCHGKSVHYCKLPHMSGVEVFKEFFCYYGERKEGADND